MKKSNLYTRSGDDGTTSLVGGERIRKDHTRLEAYGTLDEFSCFLGVVLSDPGCELEIKQQLLEIQNLLFNFGAYLATLPEQGKKIEIMGFGEENIKNLEGWIDQLDNETPPIRAFILPGGTPLSASTHVARAVCRRAERRILTLASETTVDPMLLSYINRLSDYLFILARHFNHASGHEEIIWKK